MADLVERLRDMGRGGGSDAFEAADNIEKLREAVNMLRVANSTLRNENDKLRLMLQDYERVYGHDGGPR